VNILDRLPDNSSALSKEKSARALIDKTFHLSLSDGTSWGLRADHHNFPLVSKLATIMELDEYAVNGSHELIFCRNANADVVLDGMFDEVPSKSCSSGSSIYSYFYYHRTLRMWCHNSVPDVACEVLVNNGAKIDFINMWFALHPIYQRSISKGGLPFHAGLVERGGRGFLMAASGDTGKSTCCRRLPEDWQALCDDETLIVLDKNEKFRAHPFPTWSDYVWRQSAKTWNVQYSVSLSGIFFLEQSEIDEVSPIGAGEAALLISESAIQICEKFWENASEEKQRKFRKMLFNNAFKMAKQIPAYRLGVSRNGRFWEKMEEVIQSLRDSI
jgi:SynChlorMet cassette protein ScmC